MTEKMDKTLKKLALELVTEKGTAGRSTLDFTANLQTKKGCNMTLDITYAITMAKPLKLKSGEEITSAVSKQGNIVIVYNNSA